MTPRELRDKIAVLPIAAPLYDRLVVLHWPHYREQAWYTDQRQHWTVWLNQHIERGTPSAETVYGNIQNPRMLLWLAEACGVDIEDVALAVIRVPHHSRQCNIVRRYIPWRLIEQRLQTRS